MTNTRDKIAKEYEYRSFNGNSGVEYLGDRVSAHFKAGWDACEKEYKPKIDLALTALKKAHQEMKMTVWREEEVYDLLVEAIQLIERNK